MKVIFMGTPAFALPALQALINSEHEIVAVYTAPPRPAGRGKKLRNSEVHQLADENDLEVRALASLKEEKLPECDIAVVAAYGILLPKHILDGPKYGCINIHPSLLPRWRGAAPVQRAIMAGDDETAVCIMQMDEGLDTGDVLRQAGLPLPPTITAGQLHDQTAMLGAIMTLEVIADIENITPQKQSEDGVTYAKKIKKEDELIDWSKTAEEVSCQIRGMNPFPGAYFMHEGEKFKIFEHEVLDEQGETGEVIDDELTIACGTGAVKVKRIQRQGKSAMAAEDFLRGFKIEKGSILS